MKTAIAYLRVSSDLQAREDRNGFDRQAEATRNYAHKNNILIVETYKEPWTGTEQDRPELARLIHERKADLILVEIMDRFTRDSFQGFAHLLDILALGMDILDCATGESLKGALNGHPLAKFLFKIRLLTAEYERDVTCYRLRKGRESATAKNNGVYVAGQKPQYDPAFKKRLRLLKRRKSYSQIADVLNQEGMKTVRGKRWTQENINHLINTK